MPFGSPVQRDEHVLVDDVDPAEPQYLWLDNSPAPNVIFTVVIRA